MRRVLQMAAWSAAACLACTACGGSPLTSGRLQGAIAPAFARTYVREQVVLGRPPATVADIRATASCTRGGPAEPDVGAGSDWVCVLTWLVAGVGTPVRASYDVTVRTDGCYTAEGSPTVAGPQTVTDTRGATVVNGLFAFDGCFSTD